MSTSTLQARLESLAHEFAEIEARLLDPDSTSDHRLVRTLTMRRREIAPVVELAHELRAADKQVTDLRAMAAGESDPEIVAMARAELPAAEAAAESCRKRVMTRLVRSADDAVDAMILEVRAGVGGDEAALFAGDLLEMYRRFAASNRWKIEELEFAEGDAGGIKAAVVGVQGQGVWSALGYEGGTHQVKRVPATEAQGRIHTSTATVAVLPEPAEIDLEVDPKEVREIMTTARGPGGQNVNKVATAVHLIHIPTGVEARVQETRSQTQNRERAWKLLKARLLELQRAEADAKRSQERKVMIGTGNRAEKVRTYRFKEDIVVDHRLERSFKLADVLGGKLGPLVEALGEMDVASRLGE